MRIVQSIKHLESIFYVQALYYCCELCMSEPCSCHMGHISNLSARLIACLIILTYAKLLNLFPTTSSSSSFSLKTPSICSLLKPKAQVMFMIILLTHPLHPICQLICLLCLQHMSQAHTQLSISYSKPPSP